MAVDPAAYGAREILTAIFGSTVVSAFITILATVRLTRANARKAELESERIVRADSADVERVINERVEIILKVYDDQVKSLSAQVTKLQNELSAVHTELRAARAEIATLRFGRGPQRPPPPAEGGAIALPGPSDDF